MPKKNPAHKDVRYEVITQEDPDTGDLIVPIPQPVLDSLGWVLHRALYGSRQPR